MRRNKLFAIFLALFMVLTLMAGCGEEEKKDRKTKDTTATEAEEDSGFTIDDFCGFWQYEDYDYIIAVNDDFLWFEYSDSTTPSDNGYTEYDDGVLSLYYDDDTLYTALTMTDVNEVTDSDGDTLIHIDGLPDSYYDDDTVTVEYFLGAWKYEDYDMIFELYDDYTWEMYSSSGNSGGSSDFTFDGEKVTLMDGEGDPDISLTYNGPGELMDSEGDILVPYTD